MVWMTEADISRLRADLWYDAQCGHFVSFGVLSHGVLYVGRELATQVLTRCTTNATKWQ